MIAYDIVTVSQKSITISGEIWDTVIHNPYQNAIPDFFPLMTNRDDGTWVRWDTTSHPYHLFKYPAFVGESWKISPVDTTGPDQYLNRSQMVSVEPVKIGSQTYLCNVYQYLVAGGHEGQIRNIYIAPGFTIVKGVYITSRSSSWDTVTYTLVQ